MYFFLCTFRNTCARKKKDEDAEEDKEKKHQSKMDAKFLSFTTFYYAVSEAIVFCLVNKGSCIYIFTRHQ